MRETKKKMRGKRGDQTNCFVKEMLMTMVFMCVESLTTAYILKLMKKYFSAYMRMRKSKNDWGNVYCNDWFYCCPKSLK